MILNDEQLATYTAMVDAYKDHPNKGARADASRWQDFLDTIADLKHQLQERDLVVKAIQEATFKQAIHYLDVAGISAPLSLHLAADQCERFDEALDAYVQERVDKVALASADTEVEFMNEDTLQVEKLRFRLPGETGMTANAGGWYSTAVYWKHKAIRAEEQVDRAVLAESEQWSRAVNKQDPIFHSQHGACFYAWCEECREKRLAANRAKMKAGVKL